MGRLGSVVAITLILLVGWLGWRWFFPADEVRIEKLVREAAEVASWEERGGNLAVVAAVSKLAGMCAPEVEIIVGTSGLDSRRLRGRDEVRQAAAAVRMQLDWLRLDIEDLEVTIYEPRSGARVLVAGQVAFGRVREPILVDYVLDVRNVEGDWLIARVEPVRGFGM